MRFSVGTHIYFGEDSLKRLNQVKNRRVFVVTDAYMESSGTVDRVVSYLTDCTVTVFSNVIPDPPIEVVAAGIERLQEANAEVIIALGGGSVIDAAKAIRAIAGRIISSNYDIAECFAIPTTSGTGSEVTEYAVISDNQAGIKYPLVSSSMRPPTAILDPSLVLTVPPSVTADSGMDVLTHALEAYVATDENDFSDALAEKATALTFQFLPETFQDGTCLVAREKMHNASCMAGLSFNSAGLGLCHGLSHSLGGQFSLPHGRLNAILLPYVIEFNAGTKDGEGDEKARKKYSLMAQRLGMSTDGILEDIQELIKEIRILNQKLNIPKTLKETGIDEKKFISLLPRIIDNTLSDGTTIQNPRPVTRESVKKILLEAFGN